MRFQIQQMVSHGPDATLHRAFDTQTEEMVILKASTGRLPQVENEASLLPMVQMPGVIKLKDIFSTDTGLVIALELAKGGDLLDFLERVHRIPEHMTKLMMQKLLTVLDALHKRQIAHLDIKLENILITDETFVGPNVVLGDFGLASRIQNGRCASYVGGTFTYSAPEIIMGAQVNEKADIWALGICMYACLTGGMPFTSDYDNYCGLRKEILSGFPSMYNLIDPFVHTCPAVDLLSRMLTVDPAARISASEALLHPWFGSETMSC